MKTIENFIRVHSGYIKLILLVIFIFNAGIINNTYSVLTSDNNTSLSVQGQSVFNKYADNKIEKAKRLIGAKKYSAEMYVTDIIDILNKQVELKALFTNSKIFKLMHIYHGCLSNSVHAELYKIKTFNSDRLKAFKALEQKKLVKIGIASWFINLYINSLPLAFLLFIMWLFETQDSKSKKFKLKNPINFILLLVLYPIVISYVFIIWFKVSRDFWLAEAQIRQTKESLFTILSQDEIEQIRKIVKNNFSLKVYRLNLQKQGLTFKHSFATALLATLIIALIPTQSNASQKNLNNHNTSIAKVSTQHLARQYIKKTAQNNSNFYNHKIRDEALYDFKELLFLTLFYQYISSVLTFFKQEYIKNIFHIPIFSNLV